MPVKNTAPFLEECLDSFLSQIYTKWELIAVDDRSSDRSLDILNAYAAKDQRIKVFQNEGSGVVAGLKTAYTHCTGNYISRMDSDDINTNDKFESMLLQLKEVGLRHITLGQVSYFAEGGVGDGYKRYEVWMNALIRQGRGFDEIYKECVIPSPCWLLHRDDFELMGGFDSQYYPEDYDLCFRVYKAGIKCVPMDKLLLRWRDRPMRTTRIDDNYKTEKMLALKCHYFIDIDYDSDKNLVLWGAGKRGKFIAQYLVEKEIPFSWVCNNENKIGRDIYGVILQSDVTLYELDNKQIIVSVANIEEQKEIANRCKESEWENYFFC